MIYCIQGIAKTEIIEGRITVKVLNRAFIKERRQTLNKTLQEVADSVGMKNASTYMKYENGTYSFKAEQLPVLAKTLDCEIQDFFTE
jgi:transcriptional regulator with XRE-family HTH domain